MSSRVEVYCDGSVTDAVLTDPYTSRLSGVYVGRAMVVIPSLSEGLIKQTQDGMVTRNGNPASSAAEMFAIRTALGLCDHLGLEDFVVYSDCMGEVDRMGDGRVEWRSRAAMYLPNEFFDKVLGRAAYLRSSAKVVRKRRELKPYQIEQYELFNSHNCRINLRDSPLWQRVIADAANHPDALGLVER